MSHWCRVLMRNYFRCEACDRHGDLAWVLRHVALNQYRVGEKP